MERPDPVGSQRSSGAAVDEPASAKHLHHPAAPAQHAPFINPCYSSDDMSTYAFQLLALRKQRFSFTEGLASAFDYTPIINAYNVSPTPNSADARAIASDFIATGDDMRTALADYARTQ
jgi:hypothetical protein